MALSTDRTSSEPSHQTAHLQEMAECIHDCFFLADREGSLVYLSPSASGIWGLPHNRLLEGFERWQEAIIPEDRAHFWALVQLRESDRKSVEFRIVRPDGGIRWVRLSRWTVDDDRDLNAEIAGVIYDVTHAKAVESALSQSQLWLHAMVSALSDAVVLLDSNGRVVLENERAQEMIQSAFWESGSPSNTCSKPFVLLREDGQEMYFEDFPPFITLRTGKPRRSVVVGFKSKMNEATNQAAEEGDESMIWCSVNSEPLAIFGRQIGVVVTLHDVSAIKKMESDARRSLEKERKLNVLKSNFVNMVSHEFRTPLTSIHSASEMLMRYHGRWEIEKQEEYLRRIRRNVQRMTYLLSNVLMAEKIRTYDYEYQPKHIDLDELCNEVISDVCAAYGPEHNIVLDGPPVSLKADEVLIRQILTNLLSNSIKYSPKSKPVHLSIEPRMDRVCLMIRDQGIGITEEDMQHLFDFFYRGGNTENVPGTGVGMTIVKRALELSRGSIHIESELGVGTCVFVELPLA